MADIIFYLICVLIATVVVLIARRLGMNFKSHNPVVFDFKVNVLLFFALALIVLLIYMSAD